MSLIGRCLSQGVKSKKWRIVPRSPLNIKIMTQGLQPTARKVSFQAFDVPKRSLEHAAWSQSCADRPCSVPTVMLSPALPLTTLPSAILSPRFLSALGLCDRTRTVGGVSMAF